MTEYLDKQELLKVLNDRYNNMSAMPASYYAGFKYAVQLIERMQISEEVAPVIHGMWIKENQAFGRYNCSVCGAYDEDCSDYYGAHNVTGQDYCPYCGARLDL